MDRLLKSFFLMAFSLLLISSCYFFIQGFKPSTEPQKVFSECRTIRHELGQACVPVEPKRVVALHPKILLDPLLALGIQPVGATADYWQGKTHWGGLSSDQVAGIEVIGQPYQPSLEKLLMVKPDLIIGLDGDAPYYSLLSTIAPTVLFNYETQLQPSFRESLRSLAQIVDREAEAEAFLGQYQKKIEALKAQIQDRLEGKEVSILGYNDENFWIPDYHAYFFQIFNDPWDKD
ncbi:MAG: ABC transporter substrate-binding protein [Acaryochloridaceae cyanobacterium CSU_3_4]|nr:ABC transporter substrate-binding protein [Acaryochloridaceae cyanobacterium CSU_3_4]